MATSSPSLALTGVRSWGTGWTASPWREVTGDRRRLAAKGLRRRGRGRMTVASDGLPRASRERNKGGGRGVHGGREEGGRPTEEN
ncbi:hypothetical protein E2562_018457 [Oryza meyeriana var. granulata]|uniref:DUF834 domain-containing protein n=1 Tax=Oryza meyeriana var. granulata TaxID=110450 RepID=A0A6G1EME9_9ORYZ|nr:hypothetical protein E2562_018457 [Oryza meyeriana var. granulata]